jgi:hypothetical protein
MIRLRGVEGLALLDARLPLARFLSGLALVAARVGEQQDHAGIDAGRQPIGSPALVVAAEQTARTAGQIGHVPRWSRIRSRPAHTRSQPIMQYLNASVIEAGLCSAPPTGGPIGPHLSDASAKRRLSR